MDVELGWADEILANPVISYNIHRSQTPHFLVVYEVKSRWRPGLCYRLAAKPESGTFQWISDPVRISITDVNSFNPTIATNYDYYLDTCIHHLAWEQITSTKTSRISYTELHVSGSSYLDLAASESNYISDLSYGSGYSKNYKPSIIAYPNRNAKIVWQGERLFTKKADQADKVQDANAVSTVQYKTIFKDLGSTGFRSYGTSSYAPTINKSDNNSFFNIGYC